MSRLLGLLTLIIIISNAGAQELISSSGSHAENGGVSLSWSLGEPVTETYSDFNTYITQGFHQTKLFITGISENKKIAFDISVFPNPASDQIIIEINDTHNKKSFFLRDINGSILNSGVLKELETSLNINQLQPAIYILEIRNEKETINTYKIIIQ